MAIHFRENQYSGVNAHLHSWLQQSEDDWLRFQFEHIRSIQDAVNRALFDQYYVNVSPGFINYTYNVAIQCIMQGQLQQLASIHLLSPGIKPGGESFDAYLSYRASLISSGIQLIEIDYWHTTLPLLESAAAYNQGDVGSAPYMIINTFGEDDYTLHYFHVDDEIPPARLHLQSEHALYIDLRAAYFQTFATNNFYGQYVVDYSQLPHDFETYSPFDQERIRLRMDTVAQISRNIR